MNAMHILRQMHAETKVRLKLILGADDPSQAAEQWRALQRLLELHERMEDEVVFQPLFEEHGPGTPLGDWYRQHDLDVETVKQFIDASSELDPATPAWRTTIGTIMDVLNKHVTDEEGQIFGRIEQIWDGARLEQAGQQLEKMRRAGEMPVGRPRSTAVKSTRGRASEAATPARRAK